MEPVESLLVQGNEPMTRRNKRSNTRTGARKSDFRIAVATSPVNASRAASLAGDIRLLKPALLYADSVTLYSPAAIMLFMVGQTANLNPKQRMEFLRRIYPTLEPERAPVVLALLNYYDQLARQKRGRSKEELLTYLQMKPKMDELQQQLESIWVDELIPKVEGMLESSGASQLVEAMSQGILDVDPLMRGEEEFELDQFIDAFVDKLAKVLSQRGAYPLFDDQTGTLVRHGIAEGLFATSPVTRERGKQVAAASDFMSRLPAFSGATIREILDIRRELQSPLVRFRAAMIELGTLIESAAYEEAFPEEVDELFKARVEPVLLEIEEQIQGSAYLSELIGEAVGDTKTLLTGVLAFGITESADLPNLLAGGAAATQVIASAAWKWQMERRKTKQNELYFLYRTEELLGGNR